MNTFSYIVLFTWPLVAIILYVKLPAVEATIWSFLGAMLLLPVGAAVKFQFIPEFNKDSIAGFSAVLAFICVARRVSAVRFKVGLAEILICTFVFVPLFSAVLNSDDLYVGGGLLLPGTGIYDGISGVIASLVSLAPFWLGRRLYCSEIELKRIVRAVVLACVFYSLLLLFEIRFSPQLHYWLYGDYPSAFMMSIREDGFRPMVFTGHGLIAALFMATGVLGAASLWKLRIRPLPVPLPVPAFYLMAVLILCKSAAAMFYAGMLMPIIRWGSTRFQSRVAKAIVILALVYPALRLVDVFPTQLVVNTASIFSSDRAASMQFRFDNEDKLLARSVERMFFGWGRFGRSRIYDPETGKDVSVTDGGWVITLGQFGILGFLAQFGLLTLGVFKASAVIRKSKGNKANYIFSATSLMLAIGVIDLLPNGFSTPLLMLLAGILLGSSEAALSRVSVCRLQPATGSSATAAARIG